MRIICRTHGEFEQTPAAHVNGQGCPRCVKNAPVDQAECLRRFCEIHGDEYDYSLVRYVNKDKPVKIICRKHGAFLQSPANHWHGQGCPKCYGTGKLSTGEFIRRAREVHGDRYDYSQVEYVNNHTKVRIICPVHGVFEQVPMSHLKGINCPECGNAARKVPLSPEKMTGKLEKAKATWQAKYGVDNVMQVPEKVAKMEETCLSRHGVRNYRQSPKCIEQSRATCLERYGEISYAKTEECKRKAIATNRKHWDADTYTQSDDFKSKHDVIQQKTVESRRRNGTANSSSQEVIVDAVLRARFGSDDVIAQYRSARYPFRCDFYIKSLDTYIELNIGWVHGGHWFDPNDESDQEKLAYWTERGTDYYKDAIRTWTIRDVKKNVRRRLKIN